MTRYVTTGTDITWTSDDTPLAVEMEDPERFKLYRLCGCEECCGTGRVQTEPTPNVKCKACRGEGRVLGIVATCGTPEAVGVALVTLGREGEWQDCQLGVLDSAGAKNEKWLVVPWQASARNVRDAARTLAHARHSS